MKKPIGLLFALCSSAVMAKTTLYGEANAFVSARIVDSDSTLMVNGYLSEFGFRDDMDINELVNSFFDVSFGYSPVDPSGVGVKEGEVGVIGKFGRVSLFHGQTPLGKSNDMLQLMDQDPDSLNGLFGGTSAGALVVPVGLNNDDGVMFESPQFSENVQFSFALLPTEDVNNDDTGFSLAGTFDDQTIKVMIGVEFNKIVASSQIIRVIGQTKTGTMTLGGGVQVAGNSDMDTSARTFFAYGKMPLLIAHKPTQTKLMTGITRLSDAADEKSSEFYLSLVNEQQWINRLSTYGFTEWQMQNDLEDHRFEVGAGLRMVF
jgi:hypothetical protein